MAEIAVVALHVLVAVVGLRLAVIDQSEHRLPDRITGPLAFGVLALAALGGTPGALAQAVREAAVTSGVFGVLAYAPGRPLGLGDVKLQAILGFYLGFLMPGLGMAQAVLAFFLGGAVALVLLAGRRIGRGESVAFGPAMIAATYLCVWWAQSGQII